MNRQQSLFSKDELDRIDAEYGHWEDNEVARFLARAPERRESFRTGAGLDVNRTYTPVDTADTRWDDIGLPGRYPFTRGPYPTMHRGRPWTMRQIAGFGMAADTNRRFHYLMAQGQTGLSVDFDMPTLMGYDSDHPMSEGEVGREGVAIDTLADMEALFDQIDLEKISVSMTINPSAWILFAMYIAVAEKNGFDQTKLSGTIQNDILKEYMAQKEWIYPVRPSLRIVRDCITYAAQHLPRYNPLNISGYHISEAGAVATQEVAYTMASTIQYVQEAVDAGVDVDDFAPRLSFFFVSQADFFEEIAKFRAARRVYAKIMAERFGAKKPESCRLRFHAQTAAATLTKPQPQVNIVRTAFQAMSAVLGGAQSLHTNGLDEAYSIPTEEAMKIALRTQQVIAHETGASDVVDGIGGSWYVENLTTRIEEEVWRILDEVAGMGGTIQCIDAGYFQRGIADSAYDYAIRKASGDRPVIGVNCYVEADGDPEVEVHPHDPETERNQKAHLQRVRDERDETEVQQLLEELRNVAEDESRNLMPVTIKLVKAGASMGDIVEKLRELWGTYRETPVI
jgi:methylmalonyl-CoA mutase N-terminal domain/subunit